MGDLSIHDILRAHNLLDELEGNDITRIGSQCLEEFEYDLASRNNSIEEGRGWEARYDRYLDIAMQVREAKNFPWAGAANVKFPLLTTASIQFQARSYPVIVDGSNLVKGRVLGPDPDGHKHARAERIGDHMTWQLLYDTPGWEEDTDRLLLMLPIVGCVFRKTYYDLVQRKNISRMVPAKDFVINYWATSLESAPRFTQILRFYPHEIQEKFRTKQWRKVSIPEAESDRDQSSTAPIEFLEQHCRLDLDGDEYPEPYVVTMVRESGEVVRLEPCFDPTTVTMSSKEVVRIEPKRYFTKYGFIPSPDGGFYDIGFGSLLDDITATVDTTLNQLLDAGALQNAQGSFLGSGVSLKSGDLRFRLGEWKRMDVSGGSLRDNIVPLSLPGPSQVLFNLLEMLISAAKEITSVQDVLTGAGQGLNTPATTVLAQIEQATKVMTGIFKRIHRSFGQELRILFDLNRDFLDEKAYYALSDTPGVIGRKDYQDQDIDVVPVSDPTMVNDAQKAVRAQVLQGFINDPLTNQLELRRRIFEGTGQTNIDELLKVDPPPPDPKMVHDAAKLANDRDETKARIRQLNASGSASLMTAAQTAFTMNALTDASSLAAASVKLGTDAADMEDDGAPAMQPGGAGGMAPQPGDGGIPAIPQGPPGEDAGAMGPGPVDGSVMPNGGGGPGLAPVPQAG